MEEGFKDTLPVTRLTVGVDRSHQHPAASLGRAFPVNGYYPESFFTCDSSTSSILFIEHIRTVRLYKAINRPWCTILHSVHNFHNFHNFYNFPENKKHTRSDFIDQPKQ